jgi:hypothetical protein
MAVALTERDYRTVQFPPEVTHLPVSMSALIVTAVLAVRRPVVGTYLELRHGQILPQRFAMSQSAGSVGHNVMLDSVADDRGTPSRSNPPNWEFRVLRSHARGADQVAVITEHSYEYVFIMDQPAEIVVDDTVKRIERVDDRSRRREVTGEAYLVLRGITADDVPIGALIRGPVP